ncbi:unnamed protein product [Paramecium pentaurelia]|uniref:Uncharacterized protein n=1 Tax=Paramecium pentaurelia TaxID=43138 RepID=A0A8S1VL14_9CILI|nr:unnamed protein product [Paramecium pentaurelia]
MIKNLIENAKLTAQKVMTKEQQHKQQQIESFPTFDQLAFKNYNIPKDNLWQYSIEDFSNILHQMEDYIIRLQRGYDDVCQQFLPMFNKFEMLEKERKRMAQELSEKENHCKELEQAMIEMQADADNELRKKEIIECELEQSKKELQTIQAQINWNNNQIDDKELQEINAAFIDLDKSNDEQYKQRIEALQKEIQEYIQLNKDQLHKINLQVQEIDKQSQENRQINRNYNMVLQQLADQQSKSRQEIESKQQQINLLIKENNKLINQLQQLDQQRTIELQIQLENTKQKEEIQDLRKIIIKKGEEIKALNDQILIEKQQQQQLNDLIKVLKGKRDVAISEITQMQSKQQVDNSQSITQQKLKQIRFQIQNKLIQKRKEFENMYKQYLTLICKLEDNTLSNDLMKLESTINKIVIDMQDLVDEVEDLMS